MGDHHQETKTEALNPQDFSSEPFTVGKHFSSEPFTVGKHFSSEPFTVGKHFSMLRLDNSKPSPLKRPSSPPSQQPNPKKEKLSPLFPGFSKITPLPPLPKTQSGQTPTHHPLFRRCISDPFNPNPGFDSLSDSTAPPIPNSYQSRSPENDVVPNSAVTATSPPSVISTRPPRPTLHRTVSDPSSSPAAKSGSRASSSSGDDDTPNTKRRLRRIKDRFREMTLWFEQVMLEDDEQVGEEQVPENQQEEAEEQIFNIEPSDEHVQDLDNTAVTKEDCDQKRFEESVSVDKVGDCIVIHFSCHCGVPYQFLLAGGNCYYKLM